MFIPLYSPFDHFNVVTLQLPYERSTLTMTIDVNDFIVERGGDPKKIRESQKKRHAPEAVVDEVIEMFEDHRKAQYEVTQIRGAINGKQKEIGAKKKVRPIFEAHSTTYQTVN